MAKYVMSNRRAGKFTLADKLASRDSLQASYTTISHAVDLVADRSRGETTRRTLIFHAEPTEIESKKAMFGPDVIVEPEILHHKVQDVEPHDLVQAVPLDLAPCFHQEAANELFLGTGKETVVTVRGGGQPLRGAEVMLFLAGPGTLRKRLEGRTSNAGDVRFGYAGFYDVLGVIVTPHGGFWPKLVRGGGAAMTVTCSPLPRRGPTGWWHQAMGLRYRSENGTAQNGSSIKVGVIDSGCGPHPALDHVTNRGAIIDGTMMQTLTAGHDSGSHGTHVCGIIGGRPLRRGDYGGVAPGIDLYSIRVFPAGRGANQGDIADAIDLLSQEDRVDLINMSLGAKTGSQIERDAITDALERGTLCVCAAANSAGPVEFPAAFPETLAVSAFGLLGWVPADAFPALPARADLFGDHQLYAADFTCFGEEIVCGAGGVGIVATIPERFGYDAPYAAMNGTSMASPAACGALAVLLSRDRDYQAMPGNEGRAHYARSLLVAHCRDVGLPADFQGQGIPRLRG